MFLSWLNLRMLRKWYWKLKVINLFFGEFFLDGGVSDVVCRGGNIFIV